MVSLGLAGGVVLRAHFSTLAAVSDPALQARVDELIAEIDREPTTPETARERAQVVWEWANAVAMERGFIPVNTTQVLRALMNPAPGEEVPPRGQARQLDDYVGRLALIDQPGRLGTLTIDGPAAAQAGTFQTYRVHYVAGEIPVSTGGLFLIASQFQTGVRMQSGDPAGDSYVTISTTAPGVVFERASGPISGPHGGFRGAIELPAFRVIEGEIRRGDRVTVTYGDTSGGGPGMPVPEFSNDAVLLPFYLDHGDGLLHELESPTYRVVGGEAADVHGFAPSIVGVGDAVTVSVRTEDDSYNRASGPIPAYEVLLNGDRFAQIAAAASTLENDYQGAIHLLTTRFDEPGVYRFTFRSADGTISGIANPILVEEDPEVRLYWGETHGHCGYAEGLGSLDGYFRFGREDSRLDFITLSEHDIWMDDREWQTINEAVEKWAVPNEYVVFPGYEWTSRRDTGGHHNVFFRGAGFDRVPTQEAPVLSELYRGLHARYDPDDVLVIPHAHQAGDWRLSDLGVERLIELVSGHGTFEWFGRYYLESGYQVGFIGASDDHLGHPGYSPGRSFGGRVSNILQFGSLAAVYAPSKTADDIFDGLRARSAYAASDAERIILKASLNGAQMGTSMADVSERKLRLRAIGSAPFESITVVRNNEEIYTEELAAGSKVGDGRYQVVFESESEPIIRDNPRGHRVWKGRLSFEGATVTSAEITGKINPSADWARVEDGAVEFRIATRGSRRTLDLVLADVRADARARFVVEPTQEAGRAPIIVRPNADIPGFDESIALADLATGRATLDLEVGDFVDNLGLRRLRDDLSDDVEFEWTDSDPGPGGDWYYLRVRQIDGATAWSSPWWVGIEPPY